MKRIVVQLSGMPFDPTYEPALRLHLSSSSWPPHHCSTGSILPRAQ